MILEALTKDAPPLVKGLISGMQGMIPLEVINTLDGILLVIAGDLANGRDQHACDTMRLLLKHLGINLNDYRDHDTSE